MFGFPVEVTLTAIALNAVGQFWFHTRRISRMGWLEWVLNTPSHHRVHHAKNPRYLDRNYAGVLIIWDRLFGTFTPEEEEPEPGKAGGGCRTRDLDFGIQWRVSRSQILGDADRSGKIGSRHRYSAGDPFRDSVAIVHHSGESDIFVDVCVPAGLSLVSITRPLFGGGNPISIFTLLC